MIDNYTVVTLIRLLENPKNSIFTLSVKTKKKIEEIIDDIEEINKILDRNEYPTINISDDNYSVPLELQNNKSKIFQLFHNNQVSFLPIDRQRIIYLYTYSRKEFLSNFHYQEILHVSRNTVLNDIQGLRKELLKYNLELKYTREKGYHLVGKETKKHQFAFKMISELLGTSIGEWVMDYLFKYIKEENKIELLIDEVQFFESRYNIQGIQIRLTKILYLLNFLLVRYKRKKIIAPGVTESVFLGDSVVKYLTKKLCIIILQDSTILKEEELNYLQLLLLGSFEEKLDSKREAYFESLVYDIVTEMENLSLIQFENQEDMIEGIKKHLIPAYYRIKLGFEDNNEFTNQIINNNKNLFRIVEKALFPFQKLFSNKIPDSEIAYFLVHFGGYIKDYSDNVREINALIVCPNGISSSLILKEQLSVLFPNINFLKTHRLDNVQYIDPNSYDLIFSTINLVTTKPIFIVPITLTADEKQELYRLVSERIPMLRLIQSPVNQIIEIVNKHTKIFNENSLRLELNKLLYEKTNVINKEGGTPLLHELLTEETFQFSETEFEWRDAFRFAAVPLLEKDYITTNYIEQTIAKVEEFGAFINLGKGVAIPHARPEDGVKKLSMSMLVLQNPITLPDDDKPIDILIVIAAIDNETHLSALSHLTSILREDETIEVLRNAKSFNDIKTIIYQGEDQ